MPLYIAKSGDLDRCYRCLTDWLTDSQCKDRATQLLKKYKSGALVTQLNLNLFLVDIFFSFDYCQRLMVLTISKMFLDKPESLPGWDFRQGCPLQLQALVGWWSHYRPEHEQWKSWLGFWSNNSNVKKMVFDWSIVIWKYFGKKSHPIKHLECFTDLIFRVFWLWLRWNIYICM